MDAPPSGPPAVAPREATPARAEAIAPRWLSPEEDLAWRLLLAVQRRLLGRLEEELRSAHDLGLADYDVLVVLSESPDAELRMRDLAGRVMLSPSGLTRRVDHLERRGWVVRRSCPSDGRGALAALTTEGWARLRAGAPTHVAGVRRYLFDGLSPADLPALSAALGGIAAGLGPPALGTIGPDGAAVQPGSGPETTGRPVAAQPLVPPATDTAR
jgi:DNA-binding MarR family transcriptional regulator